MTETSRRSALLGLGAVTTLAACGVGTRNDGGRKVGVAVAGVGSVALSMVIPAIAASSRCRLAGLVDIDTARLRDVAGKYGLDDKALYTQTDFDRIADNADIDVVYIAVPNALHAEYAIRAARAGKHVLVEKPMATTVAECEAMIEASRAADRQLAVAYRLVHSPHHQRLQQHVQHADFGTLKLIRADIGYPLGADAGWRLRRALSGGGALLEQGVYCVHAACQLAGAAPVEVGGFEMKSDPQRFAEVDETSMWTMRFASGAVAQCSASYTMPVRHLWAGSSTGWIELDDPFSYDEIEARTSNGRLKMEQVDQFALQMDHFCQLVRDGQAPGAGISAQDGLRDVRIINAVYESIRTGRRVPLTPA
jgi:predicted dehydrogenase